MIYDHRKDSNDSRPRALLYAAPNFNAEYTADRIDAYRWTGDYPECAVCGRTRGIDGVHHEPQGRKSLHLVTAMGTFVVKPTLVTLCKECHADRHDRGLLSFRWEFYDPDDEERFLRGEFLKRGWAEHDERFRELGRMVAEHRGRELTL